MAKRFLYLVWSPFLKYFNDPEEKFIDYFSGGTVGKIKAKYTPIWKLASSSRTTTQPIPTFVVSCASNEPTTSTRFPEECKCETFQQRSSPMSTSVLQGSHQVYHSQPGTVTMSTVQGSQVHHHHHHYHPQIGFEQMRSSAFHAQAKAYSLWCQQMAAMQSAQIFGPHQFQPFPITTINIAPHMNPFHHQRMIRAVTIKDLVGIDIRGFHLNRLIGAGSYGAVYESTSGSERIAVKASIRAADVLNEAACLQRLYYCQFTPTYYFHDETATQNGILHTIGQELLGPDLETIRQKVPWHAIKRPTLVRIAFKLSAASRRYTHSILCIEINRVTIKIFDFGLAHHYKDDNGDLIEDSTNSDFRRMKYCSYEVAMGSDSYPRDDLHQLSFAILYASGFDFLKILKSSHDVLTEWKRNLLRQPAQALPPLARFLSPWYDALSELNEVVAIDYEALKQKIQESLPAHNASADLYWEMVDGEETLV
ncbi:unnamed protein product [Caenorhabditis nigoni]